MRFPQKRRDQNLPKPNFAKASMPGKTDIFWASWKALAVYIVCLIWTPTIPMRPLPPLRADDLWLIIWFLGYLLSRPTGIFRNSPVFLYLIFGGLAFASGLANFINSGNLGQRLTLPDLYDSAIFARMALICFLCTRVQWSPGILRNLCWTYVAAIGLTIPILLVQHFAIAPFDIMTIKLWTADNLKYQLQFYQAGVTSRVVGTVSNPNYAGLFLCAGNACALYLLLTYRGAFSLILKIVLAGLVAVSLWIILFATMSRTGLVLWLLIIGYFSVGTLFIRGRINFFYVLSFIILGVAFFFVLFFRPEYLPRRLLMLLEVEQISDLAYEQSLLGGRFFIWETRWKEITESMKSMIFGVGSLGGVANTTDNGLLRMWFQSGLLGFLLAIFFWFHSLIKAHLGFIRKGLPESLRSDFLLLAALFTCFFAFELTADGIISVKHSGQIAVFAALLHQAGTAAQLVNCRR